MKRLLESSRYLVIIPILICLVSALATYLLGVVRAVITIGNLTATYTKPSDAIIGFIEVVDVVLIATTLMIFAVALYELFIGELNLPEWLVVHHFTDLKDKLGNLVILVAAVTFLKYLLTGINATEVLFYGIAVAVVSIGLKFNSREVPETNDRTTQPGTH